jgi:hypothetical protein
MAEKEVIRKPDSMTLSDKEIRTDLANDIALQTKRLTEEGLPIFLHMINNGVLEISDGWENGLGRIVKGTKNTQRELLPVKDKKELLELEKKYINGLSKKDYDKCLKEFQDSLPPYTKQLEEFAHDYDFVIIANVPQQLISLIATDKGVPRTEKINHEGLRKAYFLLINKTNKQDLYSRFPQRKVTQYESYFVALKHPSAIKDEHLFSIDPKGRVQTLFQAPSQAWAMKSPTK